MVETTGAVPHSLGVAKGVAGLRAHQVDERSGRGGESDGAVLEKDRSGYDRAGYSAPCVSFKNHFTES